jgi:hypothetical protein
MVDYSNISDEELADLIRNTGGGGRADDQSFFSDVGGYLKSHLEVPGSVGGALGGAAAGAAAGSVVPVVGTALGGIAGGVIGGALGAGAGSAASDVVSGEDVDWQDVSQEMKTSLMWDAGMLGMGKVMRPVGAALGVPALNLAKSAIGIKPKIPSAQKIINLDDIEAGTFESMKITQEFLTSRGGAGLTATQTGQAGLLAKLGDSLGDLGLFSSILARGRVASNNAAIRDGVEDLMGEGLDRMASGTVGGVGEVVAGVIETGRSAARSLYKDSLNNLNKEFGGKRVSTLPVMRALHNFKTSHATDLGSKLGKKTRKATEKIYDRLVTRTDTLVKAKSTNLEGLIELQKEVTDMIAKAMPMAKNADPKAVRDLTKLNKALQSGIADAVGRINPKAAATYKMMNKEYGDTMKNLMPKINKHIATAAEKADYDTVGRLLITGTNTSKIKKMMSSIDEAFAVAAKAGVDFSGKTVKNADEARKFLRQGYVQAAFRGMDETTDLSGWSRIATELNSPEAAARAKAVMGDDYVNFRKITNAITDFSQKGKSNMLGLAARQREVSALSNLGQMGVGAGAAGLGSLGVAGGIFLAPVVLGKLATNKHAVNRLLGLNEAFLRGDKAISAELMAAQMAKIFDSLSESDQEDIKSAFMSQ